MKDFRPRDRRGVSEVVGAMMLIIVVVTAVASLSFFLATAQQQAQNRQSYLTSVHNDNLETVYAQFYPNDPTIQWELDNIPSAASCTPTGTGLPVSWYVQQDIANASQVELIPNQATLSGTSTSGTNNTALSDSGATWGSGQWVGAKLSYTSGPAAGQSQTITANTGTSVTTGAFNPAPDASGDTYTISSSSSPMPIQANLVAGAYNSISKGVQAVLSSGTPDMLNFTSGSPNCVFEPAAWGSITLTVRNTNTQASSITGVQLNGIGSTVWYQVDQSGKVVDRLGATVPLPIPAKTSVDVMFNETTFGSTPLLKNDSLSISLESGSGNFFPRMYTFPTAIQRESTSTENYQVVTRDIVTLDGSQSYETNSSIQSYEWKLDVPKPAGSCPTTFSGSTTFDTVYVSGETIRYTPESLFSPTQLTNDCITGPIRATLLVSDGNGFMASSQSIVLPQDPNIAPPGSLSDATCAPGAVTVTVQDIFGRAVVGAVVTSVRTSGDVTTPATATSMTGGVASFNATWTVHPSSVQLQTGTLPPLEAVCP